MKTEIVNARADVKWNKSCLEHNCSLADTAHNCMVVSASCSALRSFCTVIRRKVYMQERVYTGVRGQNRCRAHLQASLSQLPGLQLLEEMIAEIADARVSVQCLEHTCNLAGMRHN